jgi:hypothetical protein
VKEEGKTILAPIEDATTSPRPTASSIPVKKSALILDWLLLIYDNL